LAWSDGTSSLLTALLSTPLQDRDDDDGLESYVRKCLDERNFEWLPSSRCLRLPSYREGDEAHGTRQEDILGRVRGLEKVVNSIHSELKEMNDNARKEKEQKHFEEVEKDRVKNETLAYATDQQ
jgi:hypothetical protein